MTANGALWADRTHRLVGPRGSLELEISFMLPSLFIGHGAPTLALGGSIAARFLQGRGPLLARPKAVLVVSAHWKTERPTVTSDTLNTMIHDYAGFPAALRDIRYTPPGSPDSARRVVDALAANAITASAVTGRGLDHGAWVPLSLAFSKADIPVLQLSVQTARGPGHALRIGRALAPLRDDLLIIGSGSLTHSLADADLATEGTDDEPDFVIEFAAWMHRHLTHGAIADLLDYRERAPFAAKNHPTEEHLLPLFTALGAAGPEPQVKRLHASTTHRALRMDAYAFSSNQEEMSL